MGNSLLHWNYFSALENDLDQVARFIEFSDFNFNTYSIELAHLLLASASEVDVIAKGICNLLEPTTPTVDIDNINDYRRIITNHLPGLCLEEVFIPRYGIILSPWSSWTSGNNPLWWKSYNNVKHHRDDNFKEANLKNVLNSMSGLLVLVFHLYKLKFAANVPPLDDDMLITNQLKPPSRLLRLKEEYYFGDILI